MNEQELIEMRELHLEATVQLFYDLIEEYTDACPYSTGNLSELAMHVYNQADIRADIDDMFEVKIEMED